MGSADLIVHKGIANVFHQAIKLLCILGVFEEIREFLSYDRVHSLADLIQFPGSLRASDSAPNPRECGPTVLVPFLFLSL